MLAGCNSEDSGTQLRDKDPVLTIQTEEGTKTFARSALLARSDLKTLELDNDPAYDRPMTFKAVAMAALLDGLQLSGEILEFRALDGFAAPISTERLLRDDENSAKAYIAIEPEEGWPWLKKKGESAGPFYLVWEDPEMSGVVPEEWPYMIAEIVEQANLKATYPKMVPAEKAAKSVHKGFQVFARNCLACHQMNGEGQAWLGPDLNVPMNPTEYFKADALKRLIRDPSSVRVWGGAKMPPFPESVISSADLSDLLSYLKHMGQNR